MEGKPLHDLIQRPGLGLTLLGRKLPAEDGVGHGKTVFPVVALDRIFDRVGNDGNEAAKRFVPRENFPHAGEYPRDPGSHVVLPEAVLIVHLFFGQPDLSHEKRNDAGCKVPAEIVLQRIMLCLRANLLEKFTEAGVMNRCGAVDHGIVMVEHQTLVAHARPPVL